MNAVETFSEFSKRLSPTDLMLYAGVGLVVWVLFKDKMSPVQAVVLSVINQVKKLLSSNSSQLPVVPSVSVPNVVTKPSQPKDEDVFFQLVVSWKQTRDLALLAGCEEAVKVADQMFPFLSPNVCSKKEVS